MKSPPAALEESLKRTEDRVGELNLRLQTKFGQCSVSASRGQPPECKGFGAFFRFRIVRWCA